MSKTKQGKDAPELLSVRRMVEAPYNYNGGRYVSRYLRELEAKARILGSRCPECGKVYVPPRCMCGPCFTQTEDPQPVSDEGILMAFSVNVVPYTDPNTGQPKEIPFTCVFVKLDGTDSNIMHVLDHTDSDRIKVGMRVKAVFTEDRTGDHFTDIKYFTAVEE